MSITNLEYCHLHFFDSFEYQLFLVQMYKNKFGVFISSSFLVGSEYYRCKARDWGLTKPQLFKTTLGLSHFFDKNFGLATCLSNFWTIYHPSIFANSIFPTHSMNREHSSFSYHKKWLWTYSYWCFHFVSTNSINSLIMSNKSVEAKHFACYI